MKEGGKMIYEKTMEGQGIHQVIIPPWGKKLLT